MAFVPWCGCVTAQEGGREAENEPSVPIRLTCRLWLAGCPWWNQVIDALVDHFMSYLSESRDLPVLWHQSLLVFAQRYRGDVTRADKDRLKEVSEQPYGRIEG